MIEERSIISLIIFRNKVFLKLALRAVQSLEAHQIKKLFELEENFDDLDWTEALNCLEAIRIEHDLEYVLKAFLSPRHTKSMLKYLQKELLHREKLFEQAKRQHEKEQEQEEREKDREERQKEREEELNERQREREIREQERKKERAEREKEREEELQEREKERQDREKERQDREKRQEEWEKSHQGKDIDDNDDGKGDHTVIIKPRPAKKDETQTIKLSPSPGSNWNIKSSGGEGNQFTFSFKGKDSKKQAKTVDVNYSEPKVEQYYVTDYEPYPVFYPDVQDTVWNFKESGNSRGNSVNVVINNPKKTPILNFNDPENQHHSKKHSKHQQTQQF
ncbi:UNKNOWN [Stylonychia lemnae]|uniref:Uncharacterized protein n=1 Tax=Stylonychia lemnae TaxID=5949 RepID=A0A078AHM5_STYLE|nr:UNKNOWN [Stylonychia lemnae]|eukprot:CDW81780.1 UNKNOWN [Stylonychia lemnae]